MDSLLLNTPHSFLKNFAESTKFQYKPFHIKDFADGKLSIALLKTRPNRIVIQSATHTAELRSVEALYFRSGVKLD